MTKLPLLTKQTFIPVVDATVNIEWTFSKKQKLFHKQKHSHWNHTKNSFFFILQHVPNKINLNYHFHFPTHFFSFLQEASANYYIILFTFIFLPIFVAFVWLNTIIASEIWKRRHAPGTRQSQSKPKKADDEDSSTMAIKDTTDETNTSSNVRHNHSSKISSGELKNSAASSKQASVFTVQAPQQPNNETHRNERQRRQMRMFKVILVLMSVFICCRLPNWIFLLYKLSNVASGRLNWLLLYSFGALGLLNCMLNPLLYTFLGETIRITSHIGSACYKFCRPCRRTKKTTSHYANNQTMFAASARRKSDGGIYLGS